MAPLLLFLALAATQEPGRFKIERTGTVDELLEDLKTGSGALFRIDEKVDRKTFGVKVEGAGFFQALDAVCRAHGAARYLNAPTGPEEGRIDLLPGPWVEHPSCYHGDFKIIVSEFTEHRSELPVGPQHWCRLYLVLLGPPWLRVADENTQHSKWTLDEAKDADGKDVLPPPTESHPDYRIDLAYGATLWKGNVTRTAERLRPFDLDRGLSSVKGKVQFLVSDAKEIEIPIEAGKTIETPAGTLTIDSVREMGKATPFFRMGMTLQPAAGVKSLKQAIETLYRIDGPGRETFRGILDLPRNGMSFTASFYAPKPPAIRLVFHSGERRLDMPFELKALKF